LINEPPAATTSTRTYEKYCNSHDVGFFVQTYAHVVRSDDCDAAEQAAAFVIGDGWNPSNTTLDD